MKGISLLLGGAVVAAHHTSAFAPPPPHLWQIRAHHGHNGGRRTRIDKLLEKNDDDGFLASLNLNLPSPEAVKENILEGNVGERGEKYVIAQFSLLFCIAVGTVPLIGDALTSFLGPALIAAGLVLVYKAAIDLKDNLSPWPVPTDPASGRGSLISDGIYSYIRHPMYSGLLLGMAGLSIFTDSTSRLMLTFLLYAVLDAKSDFEEASLEKTYGSEYSEYKLKVQSKFFPLDIKSIFTT